MRPGDTSFRLSCVLCDRMIDALMRYNTMYLYLYYIYNIYMLMIWMSLDDRVSVTGSSSTSPPSCHQHNTLSLPPVTSLSVLAGTPCKYIQIYRVSQPYYHYHQQAALPAEREKNDKNVGHPSNHQHQAEQERFRLQKMHKLNASSCLHQHRYTLGLSF